MTDARLFAWIFISVPDRGGTLQDLMAQADAVMRAVPTREELQKSLGWLIRRGLVEVQDGRYSRTSDGRDFVARLSKSGQPAMQLLDATMGKFARLKEISTPLHELSPEEVGQAYSAYQKEFRNALKDLRKKDAANTPHPSVPPLDPPPPPVSRSAPPLHSIPPSRSSKKPNYYEQWTNQFARNAGASIFGAGVLIILLGYLLLSDPKRHMSPRDLPPEAWVFTFWGAWMYLTNRPQRPDEMQPLWWNIGLGAVTVLALWISW
jgi:hypothetical protein